MADPCEKCGAPNPFDSECQAGKPATPNRR
jgi:hypothetical protein